MTSADELTAMFRNLLRSGLISNEDLVSQGYTEVATAIMQGDSTLPHCFQRRSVQREREQASEVAVADVPMAPDCETTRRKKLARQCESQRSPSPANISSAARESGDFFLFSESDVDVCTKIRVGLDVGLDDDSQQRQEISSEREDAHVLESS